MQNLADASRPEGRRYSLVSVTTGSLAKRSPNPASVDLRQPSLIFAKRPVSAPLEAMSADVVRTPNARTGPVVTHEPGPDLHFLL